MPNKYLNKKAGMSYIQITILILSMFAIASLLYTSTESVLAQERDNGRKVCCEETVTGNTCQDAYPEECSSSFQSIPSKCENSEFCEIGCCVSPENGLCNVRSSKRDCSIMGGLFESEPLCQIDQCEKGCCVFGNQAKWTTYKNCQFEGNTQNKDIPTDWLTDEEHNTEVKCIFSLSKGDQGACVFDSDEEKRCSYISREECVSKTGS